MKGKIARFVGAAASAAAIAAASVAVAPVRAAATFPEFSPDSGANGKQATLAARKAWARADDEIRANCLATAPDNYEGLERCLRESVEAATETKAKIDTSYKAVDLADLGIGSRKYSGRNLEVRGIRCYYAEVEDYRCTGSEAVSVFAKNVEPPEARKWLEENCDQVRVALSSPSCRVTLRFHYEASMTEQDIISGYQRRTVISPNTVTVILPKKRRR